MKKMYMALAAFLITAIGFSQGTITGTVVDGEMGGPLPGASIIVRGTTNGTSTDFDGNFTIEVSKNTGTLVVSFIGYMAKNVNFTSTGNIGSISLQPDAQELGKVLL